MFQARWWFAFNAAKPLRQLFVSVLGPQKTETDAVFRGLALWFIGNSILRIFNLCKKRKWIALQHTAAKMPSFQVNRCQNKTTKNIWSHSLAQVPDLSVCQMTWKKEWHEGRHLSDSPGDCGSPAAPRHPLGDSTSPASLAPFGPSTGRALGYLTCLWYGLAEASWQRRFRAILDAAWVVDRVADGCTGRWECMVWLCCRRIPAHKHTQLVLWIHVNLRLRICFNTTRSPQALHSP